MASLFPIASPIAAVLSLTAVLVLGPPPIVGAQVVGDQSSTTPTDPSAGYDHDSAPVATAIRLNEPVVVDGLLDEAIWETAQPMSAFVQTAPFEGQAGTERTEVRVVYDDDAIYIGARFDDRNPVTTRLARRDSGLGDSDRFVLLLDSYHDHETAYRFWTNPSGVKGDAIVTGNRTGGGDSSWDPVWELATRVTDKGWVAEMRIPFSQLRFDREELQIWGIQVERDIHRNQEHTTFPFTPRLERAGVSRFAHLEGMEAIDSGRQLELLPYVVARGEYLQLTQPPGVAFRNPYRSGADHFGDAGVDLKYRIASNVTLDATVNPDFGQVELDPSVINLTAFETRYAERRPFFVEGADIFDFGEGGPAGSVGRPPQLVYSRRIGRRPRGSAPSEAVFSDVPKATTILAAAKITGRVGDGWSVGILEAVTAGERADFVDSGQGMREIAVEPASNHLVVRLRRQFQGGATRLGVIGTAVNRNPSGTALEDRLHSSAYSGGVDFAHESTDRMWMFSGLASGSHVGGTAAAITRTQTSSTRYFQRPDADHLGIDPLATSLTGFFVMGFVGKRAGTFTMRNGFAFVSPGFEVNDLGFQSHADRVLFDTHYQYNQTEPGRILRSWSVSASPDAVWNTTGERVFANVNGQVNLQFLNYWRGTLRVQIDPWTDDDRLTRGGPIARSPSSFSGRLNLTSDSRRLAVARSTYSWGSDDAGGWNRSVQLNLSARIRETLQISLGPSYSRRRSTAQYVRRIEDPLAVATFGDRYVFADLDQTTFSVETRVNLTVSPTLSLQLYVEPFISAGDFGTLKEFRAPGTFDFLEYGTDLGDVSRGVDGRYVVDPDGGGPASTFEVSDPDFNYRSLLGNAVLRWEWSPGSTLFVVWQQRRISSIVGPGSTGAYPWVGSFDLGRDAAGMFGVAPDNILLIKVNYWLNP